MALRIWTVAPVIQYTEHSISSPAGELSRSSAQGCLDKGLRDTGAAAHREAGLTFTAPTEADALEPRDAAKQPRRPPHPPLDQAKREKAELWQCQKAKKKNLLTGKGRCAALLKAAWITGGRGTSVGTFTVTF